VYQSHERSGLVIGNTKGATVGIMAAAALLVALAGTASANDLSIGSATPRITWSRLDFSDGSITLSCAVTLEASLHSTTIRKVLNALIGTISRAAAECTGEARLLTETLPWHIRYAGFTGVLPNIASVSMYFVGPGILIRPMGLRCLARATESNPWSEIAGVSAGVVTEIRADESAEIPLTGEFCNTFYGPLHYGGDATVTNGSRGSVTLRLI
jgi:hypothetical protein